MGAHAGAFERHEDAVWLYGKWVNEPAQDRSEQTFFRLLDAAEELLAENHWHEVSVQHIVKRAGASVGSFYNRFHDKQSLLHCLDDRLGKECELTVDSVLLELGNCAALIPNAAQIMVSLLMRLCTERGGVIRALDIASKTHDVGAFRGFSGQLDTSLMTFSTYLISCDAELKQYSNAEVAQALKETFFIARESILYGTNKEASENLHVSLMRHFRVSLMNWH